jgi:nitrogen fixation NifU-like protein
MYSQALLDYFKNPRNVGELPPPAKTVEVVNPACGDVMRLSATFDAGVVTAVAFKTRGCTASIAAGSLLTELINGRTMRELETVTTKSIEDGLGGLAPESKHAAVLAIDALRALLRAK